MNTIRKSQHASTIPMKELRRLRSAAIPCEIVRHDWHAIRRRQFGQTTRRRTGDVKVPAHAVANAHIAKPDTIGVHAHQVLLQKFPPVCIQFSKRIEWCDIHTRPLIFEFYVMAHGACSGKSDRILFSFASQTPRSVIRPVTNSFGVTSKP